VASFPKHEPGRFKPTDMKEPTELGTEGLMSILPVKNGKSDQDHDVREKPGDNVEIAAL
jgi:hypothetical protein